MASQELASWAWLQGGALGLLLLGGATVIWKLWATIERKDRELREWIDRKDRDAREDRALYIAALSGNTQQIERMHGAIESLKAEVALIVTTLATRLGRRDA